MSHKVSTLVRGVIYPSQAAAASALGVARSTLRDALENGRLDTVGLCKVRGRPRQITYKGVTYRSIAAAATANGETKDSLYRKLSKGKTK